MWKEGRMKENKVISKKKQGGKSTDRILTAHCWAFQLFIWVIPGSSLGKKTDYTYGRCSWSS
jgi:hypothetical protein